jgi:hypothetical protein
MNKMAGTSLQQVWRSIYQRWRRPHIKRNCASQVQKTPNKADNVSVTRARQLNETVLPTCGLGDLRTAALVR